MGTTAQRAVTMASLVVAGEAIYTLPYYVKRDYGHVLVDAAGITRTELGTLNFAFGILAVLCYFPGGWLADRYPARRLLVVSLVATASGGFAFASLPPLPWLVAIFAFWGVTSVLTFWGALIKATRHWGGATEQGRAFGILDGGRGLVGALLGTIAVVLFDLAGEGAAGVRTVIGLYAAIALAAAALVAWVVPEDGAEGALRPERGQLREVAREPGVWLLAVVIFAGYAGYWGTFDVASYAVDGYRWSDVDAARLSAGLRWLRPVAAVGAGWLVDRRGGTPVGIGAFALVLLAYLTLALAPPSTSVVLLAQTATICAGTFALRGLFYALLRDASVPLHRTGTAVGVVSVVGYTPDIFASITSEWLIDTRGLAGHRLWFGLLAAIAFLGLLATLALRRLPASRDETSEAPR